MNQQEITSALNAIQVARRDALVDYYIACCVPKTPIETGGPLLSDRVTTAADLYEYLLLDTKIGPEEKTSWVAEAISSVQLYINRCLGGYDPDVNNAANSTMVRESRPGGFLYDWPAYNQVYSTWSGKERLQYYPSVYIDPSLRYNKTELFNALEQTINQGRISDNRVQKGFQQYLLGFESLANLTTISGYQAGTTASVDCRDTLYYIGRTQNAPYSYYWRSCNMGVRNDDGEISGGAWSQWLKIDAPLDDAKDGMVKPCWFNNRLFIMWISRHEVGASGATNVQPVYKYFSNIWYLPDGGQWTSYKKTPLESVPTGFALLNDAINNTLVSYYNAAASGGVVFSDLSYPADRVKVGDVVPLSNNSPATGRITFVSPYKVGIYFVPSPEDEYLAFAKNTEEERRLLFVQPLNGIPLEVNFVPPMDVDVVWTVVHDISTDWIPSFAIYNTLYFDYDFDPMLSPHFYIRDGVLEFNAVQWRANQAAKFIDSKTAFDHDVPNYFIESDEGKPQIKPPSPLLESSTSEPAAGTNSGDSSIADEARPLPNELMQKWPFPPVNTAPPDPSFEVTPVPIEEETEYFPPQIICQLTTDSASFFASKLMLEGISGLLSYSTQTTNVELNNTAPIDFNGSYGLYFWEIFFHSSFLIADRFLTEQNFAESLTWYQYIFTPTGYRNRDGLLEMIGNEVRHWNVVPLQQDHSWSAAIPPTVDPDVIAMNDPMHYKMAIFLNSVNALIERGDSCYRMLQPDYLDQAKMYYLAASQMLGPRPVIDFTNSWPNPTVGEEASKIAVVDFDDPDTAAPTLMTTLLRAYLSEQNGSFLPPYNTDLLIYWDKLEVRLFNLRHNLSLDGQPLFLPLFATPANPRDLQIQHGAGNGMGGNSVPANQTLSEYRFVVLMDKARAAVASVMQFGNALLAALVQRDNSYMTLLVQTQQQQIAALTQEIQVDNIASLRSAITASQEALKGARVRQQHYNSLYNNWISSSEETAMNLRVTAGAMNTAAMIPMAVGASVEMAPNTFGLACGGSRWGGVARAVAYGLQGAAAVLETSAQRLDISEQYRRRRQDWQIQRDNAASEVAQLEAQIQSQTQQLEMAHKQSALYVQELANLRAQYNLETSRFTGSELFNWMTGRLASLYYQLYDGALALCLTTKAALVREVGTDQALNLFTTPMWNDLYQGLLAGEGLQLELQKMDNTYLRVDKRGLEIQKTVSLSTQMATDPAGMSFAQLLDDCLNGVDTSGTTSGGVNMQMVNADHLTIVLDIASLRLDTSYGSNGMVGRFKNISVTLPALLGPYQNVEATLALGGTYVALSRGLEDSGVFMADFNDPKYLPFENDPTDTGHLVLTFFEAGPAGRQRDLVESLVDVIYQLRYTLKGH
ncbi:hypothetical protein KSS92_09965 [Pseudomonas atacamensis]|uniref:Tc toxin subunit A-related protein n=1 Tax=Pseudomonas atacamensis TaxID=2565368 RepID=UPI001C3CE8A7|nr:neuraminidase-like domain-containing protein [Pseudomonas atacamensis]QXH74805.1 hypothetical protein KSS92_09965 [Pseudomonas atacamensis]